MGIGEERKQKRTFTEVDFGESAAGEITILEYSTRQVEPVKVQM